MSFFSFVRYRNDENNTDEFEFYVKGHDFLGFRTSFVINEESMKKFVDFYQNCFSKEYKTQKSEKDLNNSTSVEELL